MAACSAWLLAAPVAQAGVGQGDIEAGVSISITKQEIEIDGGGTTKTDFGTINVSGGYFYSDMLEFKGAVNMTVTSDFTFGTLNPGADFLFTQSGSQMVPFAGASYGLAFGDLDQTDFLEFHGGIKYFFRENASVEAKLARFEPIDSDFDVGRTDLTVGLNLYY